MLAKFDILDSFQANSLCIGSALDKLLGQLGIYATWLSSIAYLQKQLRIFYNFLRHVFGSDCISFLIE